MDAIMKALDQVAPTQARELKAKLELIAADKISLRNQPQVLVDPVIANADRAIPFKPLENLLAPWLKVSPSREVTFELIRQTQLFSLTWILSLASHTAKDTINTLCSIAKSRRLPASKPIPVHLTNPKPLLGQHLSILGFSSTDQGISQAITKKLEDLYPVALAYQQGSIAGGIESTGTDPDHRPCD